MNKKIVLKKSIIGIIAGMICGFFSTGGGMILVPAFIHLLKMDEKKSRGTSVFCILPMVITSSLYYYKGNYINWKNALFCSIGGIIGGFIGAKILKFIPNIILKITFLIFLFYMGVKFII